MKIFTLFLCFICCVATEGRELIQANLIWRHGDRSSRHTYPNDPYKDIWKDGSMQLTNQGMAQEYDLGLFLKSKYGHLLSDKYREGEIFIRSTDTDRTLMSAQCVAAGLYSPDNVTKWNGVNSPWRPFPVYSEETSEDWLYLIYQDVKLKCPEFGKLQRKIRVTSPWYLDTDKKYQDFFDNLTKYTGAKDAYTIDNISPLCDNLFCLKSNKFTLPKWVTNDIMDTLIHLSDIVQGLEFSDYEMTYIKTMSKMRAGVVLAKMIENMKIRMDGRSSYSIVGYSAHDSSVGPLLSSLGALNWITPPYASCVMIDLYRNNDGSYFVEFWYRNDSNHDPYPLSFYECGTQCDFYKFINVATSVVTDETTPKLCGVSSKSSCSDVAVPIGILVTILGLSIITSLCFCVARKRKSSKDQLRYSPLYSEEL